MSGHGRPPRNLLPQRPEAANPHHHGVQHLPGAQVPLWPPCYVAPWPPMPQPPCYVPGYGGGGLPYMHPYVFTQQDGQRVFYQQPVVHPYMRHFLNPYRFPPATIPYQTLAQPAAYAAAAAATLAPPQKVAVVTREVQTSTDDLNVAAAASRTADSGEEPESERRTGTQRPVPPGDWQTAACELRDALRNRGSPKQSSSGIGSLPASTEPSDQEEHSGLARTMGPADAEASRPAAGGVDLAPPEGDRSQAGGRDGGIGGEVVHGESDRDGSSPPRGPAAAAAARDGAASPGRAAWSVADSTVPIYDAKSSLAIPRHVEVCRESAALAQAQSANDASSRETWSVSYEEYRPSSSMIARLQLVDERLPQNRGDPQQAAAATREAEGGERRRSEGDEQRRRADAACAPWPAGDRGCARCHRLPLHQEHCRRGDGVGGGGGRQCPDPCPDAGCAGDEASSCHSPLTAEELLPATSTADVNSWAWLESMDDEYVRATGKARTSVLSLSVDSVSNHNGLDAPGSHVPLPQSARHEAWCAMPYLGGNVYISNHRPEQQQQHEEAPASSSAAVFTRRCSSIVQNRDATTSSSPVRPKDAKELASPPPPSPQLQHRRASRHGADEDTRVGAADDAVAADERYFPRPEVFGARADSRPPPHQLVASGRRAATAAAVPSQAAGVEQPANRKQQRDDIQGSPCVSHPALPQETHRQQSTGAVLKKIAAKRFPKTPCVQERRPKPPHRARKEADDGSLRRAAAARSPNAGLPAGPPRDAAASPTPSVVDDPGLQGPGGRRRSRCDPNPGGTRHSKQRHGGHGVIRALHGNPGGFDDGQVETDVDRPVPDDDDEDDDDDDDLGQARRHCCRRHSARPAPGSTTSVPGPLAARPAAECGGDGGCFSRQGSPERLQDTAKAYAHLPEPRRTYSRRSFIRNSSKARSASRGDRVARQLGKQDG